MNDFDRFILELGRMIESLPGEESHKRMMARPVRGGFSFKERSEETRMSGVLACFYQYDKEILFPLIQRPSYQGAHSGQISFPGGKREKDDESIIHTALREAREEVNIEEKTVNVVGTLTDLFVPVSNHVVTPVIGFTRERPELIKDNYEVEEIIEVKLSDFLNEENRREKLLNIRGYEIMAPYFALNDRVVWGATAMMLSELHDLIRKTKLF